MPRTGALALLLPSMALLLGVTPGRPATAQVLWDMPNIIVPKPNFGGPEVKARPDIWPRLDRGAVLCRTEPDLLLLAASRRGQQTGQQFGQQTGKPNCQVIREPTAIQIVRRTGPGRTQVSVTERNGLEGWTDAWLPEKAPPIGGKGAVIR